MTASRLPRVRGLAVEYAAGTVIEAHAHADHQVVHAVRGVMRVTTAEGRWVIPPGRALWVPAGRVHGIRCLTAVTSRTVYLGAAPRMPAECEVWNVSPLLREVVVRLAEGAAPRDRPHLKALLMHEMRRVEVAPLRLLRPADPRLRRVTDVLAADPADPRTLTELARLAGAAPRTLMRLFAQHTGMSFREWRSQARLVAAVEALARGRPVTAVALDSGYGSVSAFIQMFRRRLGTTPSRYFPRPP